MRQELLGGRPIVALTRRLEATPAPLQGGAADLRHVDPVPLYCLVRVRRHMPSAFLVNERRRNLILPGHARAERMGRLLAWQLINPEFILSLPKIADAAGHFADDRIGFVALCLRLRLVDHQGVGLKASLYVVVLVVNNFVRGLLRLIIHA